MATPNKTNGNGTKDLATTSLGVTAVEVKSLEDIDCSSPDTGITVMGEEGIYSARFCKNKAGQNFPVQGWLTGLQPITHKEFGEKMCLVIELTKPSARVFNGEPRLQLAGRMLIPIGDLMEKEGLDKIAENESERREYFFKPIGEQKTGSGNTLTIWDVKLLRVVSREEFDAAKSAKLAAALNAVSSPAALPAAAS